MTKQCLPKGSKTVRVLIDTNIILDVLCDRPGLAESSGKICKYCEIGLLDGYVYAMSIPNIMYILRKEMNLEKARKIIDLLDMIFTISDLTSSDLKKAADTDFTDFEDALQSVCASRIRAQYIITRNIRHYKNSSIPAITPDELTEKLNTNQDF